jgi:hypothetical protein
MRTRRITKTAWFGPKQHIGWGWSPNNWRGLLTTTIFIALNVTITFTTRRAHHHALTLIAAHLALAVLFLTTIVLTGDPPGGPKRCTRRP